MLNFLATYEERATNYILVKGLSQTLLKDYMLDKTLFYNKGSKGLPTGNSAIWRALPDSLLLGTLLPTRKETDVAHTRDEIVEFIIDNMYTLFVAEWDSLGPIARGYYSA